MNPSVEWDSGLLRGTLGATSTSALPLYFFQVSAPNLGGSLAASPGSNGPDPIFGSQGQFTYLPAAAALRNPGTVESFTIAVGQVTPFTKFITGLPLIGTLATALIGAVVSDRPILSRVLAPLIGTSQLVTFTETPAGLAAGRPTAFTDTVTSFDGTPIHINYFPATSVAAGSVTSAPTVLLNAGIFTAGYTDPDTLYNEYSPQPTGAAAVPGIKVLRDDAFPGVYSGGGGYNVITWDSRGTFASGGQWQFNNPFFEGRDISAIIDWTTTQANPAVAQIKTDAAGVPLVGSAGGSFGGAIQLNVAATDPRIKATVPAITWNSLNTALYTGEQFPNLWGLLFLDFYAQANLAPRAAHAAGSLWPVLRLNPQAISAFATGAALGWLSEASQAFLGSAGPTALLSQVSAPTLLIQGTVDTLVPLRQAVDTAKAIETNPYATPVKMIWFCGGHGQCSDPAPAQTSVVMGDTLRWLDQYVAGSGTPADAIPRFQWFDQTGAYHSSSLMPYDPGFNQSQPYIATGSGGVLGIAPLLGGNLSIPLSPPAGSQIVGSPTLSFTYQGLGTGRAVYADVVDTRTPSPYVVGQVVTPVPVTLDGRPHTVTIALNDIAYTTPSTGTDTLALKLIASPTLAEILGVASLEPALPFPYADLTAFGVVNISDVRLDLPLRATSPAPLTIPGFVNPYGVAAAGSATPNPGYVYVTNNTFDPGTGAGGTVSVINPNNTVVASLPAGRFPAGVAVSQAGASAGNIYVANQSGSVSVFDPTGAPVATVDVGLNPGAVAVSPAGPNAGNAYVVNQAGDSVSVIDATNTVSATIAVGRNPNAVAVSPTGYVYTANSGDDTVSVIEPAGTVVKTIGVGRFPYGIAVSPAGANAGTVYVTNYNDNTVSVINPAGTVIATIGVGAAPFGIAVSPAGMDPGTVYVANYADGTVSVIRPDNTVVATIPVGVAPIGVGISPTGNNAGNVYVTNNANGTVSVIR